MYFKNITNGYITAIGKGNVGIPITEAEYNELLSIIRTAPTAPPGHTYMLRADTLEWELVELQPSPAPEPEDAEISDYEQELSDLGVRFE